MLVVSQAGRLAAQWLALAAKAGTGGKTGVVENAVGVDLPSGSRIPAFVRLRALLSAMLSNSQVVSATSR